MTQNTRRRQAAERVRNTIPFMSRNASLRGGDTQVRADAPIAAPAAARAAANECDTMAAMRMPRAASYRPRTPSLFNPTRDRLPAKQNVSAMPQHGRDVARLQKFALEHNAARYWAELLPTDAPVSPAVLLKFPGQLLAHLPQLLARDQVIELQHAPFGFVATDVHDILGIRTLASPQAPKLQAKEPRWRKRLDTAIGLTQRTLGSAVVSLQEPVRNQREAFQMYDQCWALLEDLDGRIDHLDLSAQHGSMLFVLAQNAAAIGARLIISPSTDMLEVILPTTADFQARLRRYLPDGYGKTSVSLGIHGALGGVARTSSTHLWIGPFRGH